MRRFVLLLHVLLGLTLPMLSQADPVSSIRWRIENPFRLFRDASDFDRLRIPSPPAAPGQISGAPPDTAIQDWFSGMAHRIDGDFLPYRRTFWDPTGARNTTGQYTPGYVFPKSHRIVLELPGAGPADRCDWLIGTQWQRNASCAAVTADIPYRFADGQTGTEVQTSCGTASSNVVVVELYEHGSAQRRDCTTVQVVDTLVLALGDSYNAGEGAPDRPSRVSVGESRRIASPYKDCGGKGACVWFPKFGTGVAADWWDRECDRSLLAWPVLTALRLASYYADAEQQDGKSAAKQHAVTFVSYACSGAAFYDGIFRPQQQPPGPSKANASARQGAPQPNVVQTSQLRAAGADLCDVPGGTSTDGSGMQSIDYYNCPRGRKADVVLLSVGGNDSGFAKVIMHGLLPDRHLANTGFGAVSLATMHRLLGTVSVEESKVRRLRMLPHYATLARYLAPLTAADGAVFFMSYPNPLMRPASLASKPGQPREEGRACGVEMRAGMEAARLVGSPMVTRVVGSPVVKFWWHFWFTQQEAQDTVDRMVVPLQKDVGAAVLAQSNWHYVTGHLAEFAEHGLCADARYAENDARQKQPTKAYLENVQVYGLPRLGTDQGNIMQEWRAYNTSERRWIRTPNDTVRAQTAGTLAESLHGAFHPNGAGYAAMADAAFAEVRAHLDAKLNTAQAAVPTGHEE